MLVLLGAFLPPTWTFTITIGGVVTAALASTIYSFVSCRRKGKNATP